MSSSIIDTTASMAALLNTLVNLPINPPSLYIDLEGIYLSRKGSVSILQLLVVPQNHVYLIDIHVLGHQAFSTTGSNGQSFKKILESVIIPKVFFDVRNDSDALYSHFQIHLGCVQDIQVMEFGSRTGPRKPIYVNGLSRCIDRDSGISSAKKVEWQARKDRGIKLFSLDHGGSYEVFNVRPLPTEILVYCVQDVLFLPVLWTNYQSKLNGTMLGRVGNSTRARVELSQSAEYDGKGPHMAYGPW